MALTRHSERPSLAVDIAQVKPMQLRKTDASGIQKLQNGPVADPLRGVEAWRFDPTKWEEFQVAKHTSSAGQSKACYSDVELRVIYIKLSIDAHLLDTYPESVIAYQRTHAATFPHQTTGDQNYPPAQFRAYRDLGTHIVRRAAERIEAEVEESTVQCVGCLVKKETARLP